MVASEGGGSAIAAARTAVAAEVVPAESAVPLASSAKGTASGTQGHGQLSHHQQGKAIGDVCGWRQSNSEPSTPCHV